MSRTGSIRRARGLAAVAALVVSMVLGGTVASVTAAPAGLDAPVAPARASATINGVTFDAGYIISDALFYSKNAMTVSQIQSFLDMKIGTCQNSLCLNVYRQTTYDRTADRTICAAYKGVGNETAATIIYKVQVACGISAKVLLATLQKEQGLITAKAPTASKLKIAMGYACPDTAPCNAKYYGFYNQMYSAAWQFKRYSTPDPWGSIQPGTESILYNPNASCGRKSVYVRNNATAALYNYTPYTPNAAALAKLGQAAPPCGSYGNRNFWDYYNSWFGTSIGGSPTDAINSLYLVLGGASGRLGTAGTKPTCATSAASCTWTYQHGLIYWTKKAGPIAVAGAVGDYYVANGGVSGRLGIPLANDQKVTDPNGNGYAQKFAKGWIHSSAAGTFSTPNVMMTAYSAAGWLRGSLGWPTTEATCGGTGVGCVQSYAGGKISGPAAGPANVMAPAIATAYDTSGGPGGTLGLPVTATQKVTDKNGNGFAQKFEKGWIHSSVAGTFTTSNPIMAVYSANGWLRGFLGWPTGTESCDATACTQPFAGGTVRAPVGGGAGSIVYSVSNTAIKAAWDDQGGAGGPLGVALGAAQTITDPKGNGFAQKFEHGWIHSSSKGTFVSSSVVMTAYSAGGWLRGTLGWPTSAETCADGFCSQSFSGGTIRYATGGAAYVVPPVTNTKIKAVYTSSGGSTGPLGYAVAPVQTVTDRKNGNGYAQKFEKGWIHSGPAGAWWSPTAIMTAYSARGWVRGTLGWPSGAANCDSRGCVQRFQHGTIDTH